MIAKPVSLIPRELMKAEARWIAKLERTLLDCPDTLELATTGDRSLGVWCRKRRMEMNELKLETADGGAERWGAEVATVRSACLVHGVSG